MVFSSSAMARPLPPVALASKSARRRELLRSRGFELCVIDAAIDDGELEYAGQDPRAWVMSLAYLKAEAARRAGGRLPAGWLILGADTVCVQDGRVLGQPGDAEDARRMIRQLRDNTHRVLTGVALLDPAAGTREIFVDEAAVTVGTISDEEIDAYVAGGDWRGKAGGYNLSERLAAGWPLTYSGDPSSIMGLPMDALTRRVGS